MPERVGDFTSAVDQFQMEEKSAATNSTASGTVNRQSCRDHAQDFSSRSSILGFLKAKKVTKNLQLTSL